MRRTDWCRSGLKALVRYAGAGRDTQEAFGIREETTVAALLREIRVVDGGEYVCVIVCVVCVKVKDEA